jgi:hypothetical protein
MALILTRPSELWEFWWRFLSVTCDSGYAGTAVALAAIDRWKLPPETALPTNRAPLMGVLLALSSVKGLSGLVGWG